MFQRYALCKLRVLTEALPCILLFLVRGNGQSAQLVTQNQNGAIIMAVSFQTPVETLESGSYVEVNGERITFNTVQDARHFGCLVKATNFYCCGRKADHASLEDLKAYVLITAVKNQKKDVIEQLLRRILPEDGALQSESFVVVFMLASQRLANQLIETSESNPQGSNIPLFCWAVQCGFAPLVKLLLIELPTTNRTDWQGLTPLGFASFCGHEPIVRLLIDSGTDVQATDSSGLAALHHACSEGHEGVARLLLRSGAHPEVKDDTNYPIITIKYGSSALHSAVRNGHQNIVQLLIDSGADIEDQDSEGLTPLCKATRLYHEAIIALLLAEGANVNQRDNQGMNATHFALESPMSKSTVRAILAKQLGGRDNNQGEAGLRREKVVLKLNSEWAKLYVDSPNAIIDMPKDIPSNVECAYDRMITINRPSGNDQPSRFEFEFEFMIVHNENKLDFSIGCGDLGAPESVAWFDIKIGNWWERRGLLESRLTVFTGVELGETASRSSAEDRTVYRQVKDEFWEQ